MELDPELAVVGASQLAALADEIALVAAEVHRTVVDPVGGRLGFGPEQACGYPAPGLAARRGELEARRGELAAGIGRDATGLALVVANLRRYAGAAAAHEGAAAADAKALASRLPSIMSLPSNAVLPSNGLLPGLGS
ncbi:MAG TPA: hypothetical protein VNP03_03735 [Pseudonocardia sp.]|nr:hypothetical protein [Pseudonocardia sp.]